MVCADVVKHARREHTCAVAARAQGLADARRAGRLRYAVELVHAAALLGDLRFDVAYTSALSRAQETLAALYGGWDRDLAERVATGWPAGPPWDAAFLAWLGSAYERLARRAPASLRALPSP